MSHHEATPQSLHVALTDDERAALDALGRDVLRASAGAPDVAAALHWAEAGCACLRVLSAPDLRAAGKLFDRSIAGAPFEAQWQHVTAPIAARAEAMVLVHVEQDIDAITEHLARP